MSYRLRIIQEYFPPKIGRKIRKFSLGRKNHILIKIKIKKECISTHKLVVLRNVSSTRIVLSSFHLFILRNSQLESEVCLLPYK